LKLVLPSLTNDIILLYLHVWIDEGKYIQSYNYLVQDILLLEEHIWVWHLALATCREVFGKIPVIFYAKKW